MSSKEYLIQYSSKFLLHFFIALSLLLPFSTHFKHKIDIILLLKIEKSCYWYIILYIESFNQICKTNFHENSIRWKKLFLTNYFYCEAFFIICNRVFFSLLTWFSFRVNEKIIWFDMNTHFLIKWENSVRRLINKKCE